MSRPHSICVRPLTKKEHDWFCERTTGRESKIQGSISMMWSERHFLKNDSPAHLTQRNISYAINNLRVDTVDLTSEYLAVENIMITSNEEVAYYYLIAAARTLEIEIVTNAIDPTQQHPIFFESLYSTAFLECIHYVDQVVTSWNNKRSVLARWFGCMEPDLLTTEAKQIREEVIRILMRIQIVRP